MNSSQTIVEISKALVKAQSKMGGAVKGASNPFFKSKYSDLNSVIEACKEELNNEGITVLQPVSSDEHGDYVETILLHTSGEYISSKMKLVLAKQDMQAYGSAISYARRYSLQSIVFIPSSEDDDGEKSMARPPAQAKTQYKPNLVVEPGNSSVVPANSNQIVSIEAKTITTQTSAPAKTGFGGFKASKPKTDLGF
jgi:hypothetical protein